MLYISERRGKERGERVVHARKRELQLYVITERRWGRKGRRGCVHFEDIEPWRKEKRKKGKKGKKETTKRHIQGGLTSFLTHLR